MTSNLFLVRPSKVLEKEISIMFYILWEVSYEIF